VDILLVSVI